MNEYKVNVNGSEVTMLLSDDELERYPNAQKVGSTDERTTASEQRQKSESDVATKQRRVANKSAE